MLNDDGGLKVFFPRNSFVTNTTLTQTNSPRQQGGVVGNDHIACYGGSTQAAQVTWHNSGGQLMACNQPCRDCGRLCQGNGAVGVDPREHTDIHMYTDSTAYMNQDLECRVSGGQSAFIGVYLKNGGECGTGTVAKLFGYLNNCIHKEVGAMIQCPNLLYILYMGKTPTSGEISLTYIIHIIIKHLPQRLCTYLMLSDVSIIVLVGSYIESYK